MRDLRVGRTTDAWVPEGMVDAAFLAEAGYGGMLGANHPQALSRAVFAQVPPPCITGGTMAAAQRVRVATLAPR